MKIDELQTLRRRPSMRIVELLLLGLISTTLRAADPNSKHSGVVDEPLKIVYLGGSPEQGLVWLFPGIEGGGWMLDDVCRAYRDAGVSAEIRIFDWSRPFGTLSNLQDEQRNRRQAARIALNIAEFHQRYPDAPIDLVGYSGGGGLAIMVAEVLSEKVSVRHIVLAHPALSPDYDLTPALGRVSGKIINFHSKRDWFTLGLGTELFGTMDRKNVASAGKDGFNLARSIPDPSFRAKLVQFPWSNAWLKSGHYGMHICIVFYRWNRDFVAPTLAPGSPMNAVQSTSPTTNR